MNAPSEYPPIELGAVRLAVMLSAPGPAMTLGNMRGGGAVARGTWAASGDDLRVFCCTPLALCLRMAIS